MLQSRRTYTREEMLFHDPFIWGAIACALAAFGISLWSWSETRRTARRVRMQARREVQEAIRRQQSFILKWDYQLNEHNRRLAHHKLVELIYEHRQIS